MNAENPDLTSDDWEYIERTPAFGKVYHNNKLDQTAIKYRDKLKLYYNRIEGTTDIWAIHFNECVIFEAYHANI